MQHPTAFATVRHPVGGRSEDTTLKNFPPGERILVVLAHQPWASASNLARRLEFSDSEIHKECRNLEKNKLIAGRQLGVTRRKQRRYVLTLQGVMHVTKPFQFHGLLRDALPLTWQMTEEGAKRLLLWLPMIESLYEILPTFWTGGLAAPFQWQSIFADPSCTSYVWLGVPELTEVLWLPRGRLHIAATWRFKRHDGRTVNHSIAILWSGLLPQEDYRARSLRLGSEYIRSPRSPGDNILWEIECPVFVIGMDQFAAFRAGTAYGDDVQLGSVDTAGALVWSAEASHSEWTLADKPPQARSIGHPEAAAIGEGSDMVNLGGVREYKLLTFLSDFRGATKANLTKAFHMSHGATATVFGHLEDRGLVTSVGENLYVTRRGLEMLAARDRVDVGRLVEVTHLDPEGEDAIREKRHDAAVAEVAAAFLGVGVPAVAGWRWVVSWNDGQLVPDLWVQLPGPGRDEGTWAAVEVEFSAQTVGRIEAKLRSYRLAPMRLNQTFPMLVITGEALPARRFDDLAGDLPILTTTLKEFLTGVWEGPESVWRRKGQPVGMSHIARGHRGHLSQQTGRSLDYSKPAPEVWEKLIIEEFIWSDPDFEGLGQAVPLIDPRLQAEMDGVLNEAKAGPSEESPVSAPIPPTPPPAPVRKASTAEDKARKRSLVLTRIDRLVASGDEIAASRLKLGAPSDAERFCLQLVRAIITHGAYRYYQAGERLVEQSLQSCLALEDKHRHAVRSGNPLWWLTASQTKTDPRWAFKGLLKGHPKNSKDTACERFDDWADTVDQAARAARKARTLE